jgi:predicted AlkP superfamily pyrophosphatase or phosphodiesterase
LPERRGLTSLAGRGLAVVFLAAAAWVRAEAGTAAGPADTVVVLSVDGMRWDYPARAGAATFARLASEGASCRALLPPFPSSTFPAHASLATGVFPDRHGIVNNEFLDRRRGPYRRDDDASWLLAEPIWVTAERQGVRTAVYHWVFSYTPWRGVAATRRVPYSAETTDREKIERIIRWLSLQGDDRPRLILSYLHGPDAAGHADGPESGAVLERVRQTDRLVARLLRALERVPKSALIVVSDHGMAGVSRVLRTRDLFGRGESRPVRAVSTGAVCNVYCPDLRACGAAESALKSVPGMTVYRMESLPGGLRYRQPERTGDLVAIAPPGTYFADGRGEEKSARGMHGYPPEQTEMQGIFYAWGAGVRRGALCSRLRAVDVAPLVCRLLGMKCPEDIDGRAPEDLLEPAVRPGLPRSDITPPGSRARAEPLRANPLRPAPRLLDAGPDSPPRGSAPP